MYQKTACTKELERVQMGGFSCTSFPTQQLGRRNNNSSCSKQKKQ